METLKSGIKAKYDAFYNIIECTVMRVYKADTTSLLLADIKIDTDKYAAYTKGEVMVGVMAHNVIPTKCLVYTEYGSKILPYKIEVDA